MRTIVSAKEMRWCDDATIRKHGIPGLKLMENAGRGVAEAVARECGPPNGKHILIFCGKGNNGGDGFVAARHLLNAGARVTIVLLASARSLEGDAKTNYEVLLRLKSHKSVSVSIKSFSRPLLKSLPKIWTTKRSRRAFIMA